MSSVRVLDPRSSSTMTCAHTPTRTEALLLVTIGLGFHEAPGCLVRTFKVYTWSRNSLGEVRTTVEENTTLDISGICEIMGRKCLPLRKPLPGGITPIFYMERDIQESSGS